jgi:cytochrome c biogenesis protein CcmG/thiol:disulfide interchange protein DsbE
MTQGPENVTGSYVSPFAKVFRHMLFSLRLAFLLPPLLSALVCSTLAARADDLDLSAYKGKVVYLDFWASWCVPCRLSFPFMAELQQTYGARGLVVVAVDVDRNRAAADEFLKQMPPAFRIVYDPAGRIAGQYDFKDMPTTVLVGRDGKNHFVHSGFFPEKEGDYIAHVSSLLNAGG